MHLLIVLFAVASGGPAQPGDDPGRSGRLVLVAGGAKSGEHIPALEARLSGPFGVGFDAAGTLYFVEMIGQRVRTIDRDHLVETLAGTGTKGDGGDGDSGWPSSTGRIASPSPEMVTSSSPTRGTTG